MINDWLKFKKYPHIGEPLSRKQDGSRILKYVTNPHNIANHKFTPLLHRTISQRKYRPKENSPKNDFKKRQRVIAEKKNRDIFFPSHLDSIIYGYYSFRLTNAYEQYLADKPYGNVAVAYRKIPIEKGKIGNKSNIEFAHEAFDFIEKNKSRKLSIIVADVTSFFDKLNHRLLHSQWKRVLGVNDLPADHYVIYKSLISKKYVNENELYNRFKHKLIVERFKPHDTSQKILKRKHVKEIYNLHHEKVVAFCTIDEFLNEALDLVRVDKPYNPHIRKENGKSELKGIPQGTPISATLANIYMLDFDKKIYQATSDLNKNAFYQRYSDDLIIICDQGDEDYFFDLIRREIEIKSHLEIQPKKTKVYRYERGIDGAFVGGIVKDGAVSRNKQLEYLGFNYDGDKVLVKSAGFSKFYRAMRRSFRRGAHFARKAHIPSDSLFETRLYKRFTHLGSARRLKWLPDSSSPSGFKRTKHYDWGNFISYLNKSNQVMRHINKGDLIKKQHRKVWNKFHQIKKRILIGIQEKKQIE
jgi:hypothetical protein